VDGYELQPFIQVPLEAQRHHFCNQEKAGGGGMGENGNTESWREGDKRRVKSVA